MRRLNGVLRLVDVSVVLVGASLLIPQPATAAERKKARSAYYLTKTEHAGDSVLTACAAGFHMASLWEIFDPSNLRYDTVLGQTADDAGSGPPTRHFGWIRTGAGSGSSGIPGESNCRAWTTADPSTAGTIAALASDWGESLFLTDPWQGGSALCTAPQPVWCVEDE
jgi:hypothetical protein